MICPGIWKFNPPNTSISCKVNQLTDEFMESLKNNISSHSFNKLISVVIPDTNSVPETIKNSFADSDHYILHNVRVSEFITQPFIEGFINRGCFSGISVNTRTGVDDCIAITPRKHLYLSLNKEIFQSLGLEGNLSSNSRKSRDRYTIKLDLNSKELRNGSKYFERVKSALSHEILANQTLQICWTPPESTICPSSVAKYFADRQYDIQLVRTKVKYHQEYNLRMPLIGKNSDSLRDSKELFATPHELAEYVGMVSLSCNLERDDYLSSYQCVAKSLNVGSARVIEWNGMFDCTSIIELLDELKKYVSARPNIPWVSLYCNGFPHAAFGRNGDNSYVVMLTSDLQCLWYQISS